MTTGRFRVGRHNHRHIYDTDDTEWQGPGNGDMEIAVALDIKWGPVIVEALNAWIAAGNEPPWE